MRSLIDDKGNSRLQPVRSAENIIAVAKSVQLYPNISCRLLNRLIRILHKDLGLFL